MKRLLLGISSLFFVQNVFAQTGPLAGSNPRSDEYFTVHDVDSAIHSEQAAELLNPLSTAQNLFAESPEWMTQIKAVVLSLLQFTHHDEAYGDVSEPYSRQAHFGTWIRDKSDGTCYNTRAKVLIRDSKTEVAFNSRGCTVVSGNWDEPYTGREVYQASDIQIDHLVPLKNAYLSGAYKWNYSKRCLYANFMGNAFHLIAADASQNMKKGDRTPEGFMPQNSAYACSYLAQWLKIKLIWNLGLTPSEKEGVVSLVEQNHCDLQQFSYSAQELQQQRKFMAEHMNLCQ